MTEPDSLVSSSSRKKLSLSPHEVVSLKQALASLREPEPAGFEVLSQLRQHRLRSQASSKVFLDLLSPQHGGEVDSRDAIAILAILAIGALFILSLALVVVSLNQFFLIRWIST